MTQQITDIITSLEDSDYEEASVVLYTYISRLEQRIAELEEIEKQIELVHTQLSYMTLYAVQKAKQVEELEAPKTCDGCKWEHNHQVKALKCSYCTRQNHLTDHYEPKATK